MIHHFHHRTLVITFFLLVMMGCASTAPTRFFTLRAISSSDISQHAIALHPGVAIGVGPIEIPEYMDRPQIVTRSSKHELAIDEFNRWASPVKNDMLQNIAENLSILLSTENIYVYPWKQSAQINYQVTPEIIRFDGELGGNVVLRAHWIIYDGDSKEILFSTMSNVNKEIDGDEYRDLVAAQSQALGDLSHEIANAISTISREGPGK